jgi:hypothetical protein
MSELLLFKLFSLKNSLKTKKYYLCGGEMAERSNAAVLKTVDLLPRIRGFESLFLRQMKNIPRQRDFCFQTAKPGSPERGWMKIKIRMSKANEMFFI